MSLKRFRDSFQENLLRFLWREWTALGVAGQDRTTLRHLVDPEALVLFTCSMGRFDQRLFDEVMDWLIKNGRFLNIQRMRNILRRERFLGGAVLSAVADWLSKQEDPMKWRLLAKRESTTINTESLFYLADGRPMPQSKDTDVTFQQHGFMRSPITLRGYSQSFPPDTSASQLLSLRALMGVNARCDVLSYLALNGTGHPSEVARELYYSQKAIHEIMTDMTCSGMLHSSRDGRARKFRLSAEALSFLCHGKEAPEWINWPILLSTVESVWGLTETLHTAKLDPIVASSEITLTMKPLMERLSRYHWAPAPPSTPSQQGIEQLQSFQDLFNRVTA